LYTDWQLYLIAQPKELELNWSPYAVREQACNAAALSDAAVSKAAMAVVQAVRNA